MKIIRSFLFFLCLSTLGLVISEMAQSKLLYDIFVLQNDKSESSESEEECESEKKSSCVE